MPDEKCIRVIRTIEYVGPRSWIKKVLGDGPLAHSTIKVGTNKTMREVSVEEVKELK